MGNVKFNHKTLFLHFVYSKKNEQKQQQKKTVFKVH